MNIAETEQEPGKKLLEHALIKKRSEKIRDEVSQEEE
jgi:hypothetical protein